MTAYFITATGTDIGKTYVTSLMLSILRQNRRQARACKPVMSGVQDWQENDAASLLRALGQSVNKTSIRSISPYVFRDPFSPHRAAELVGKTIAPDELLRWCQDWLAAEQNSLSFIEGVGGVMVPVTRDYTVLDWMRELGLPVVMVTGDYLGTLSHTLTALHQLHQSGIAVKAVIVNQSEMSVEHNDICATLTHMNPYQNVPVLSLPRHAAAQISNAFAKDNVFTASIQDFLSFTESL
jgi:dethiobiotin synthetase